MSNSFIPLAPSAGASQTHSGNKPAFQSLAPNSGSAAAKEKQISSAVVSAPLTEAAQNPASLRNCVPTVSTTRDGDRISHIKIQCSCGEVIELDCKY
jgi:hypothetical protein